MGKKNKRQKLEGGSSSEGGGGESKNNKVKYSEIPEEQRKEWVIKKEAGVAEEYMELLEWVARWGTMDGFDFDGIRSIKWDKGCPLIEVVVVYKKKRRKFLISRFSLYILAFCCGSKGWKKFNDSELIIDLEEQGGVQLKRTAAYKGKPWEALGPKPMIKGIKDMGLATHFIEALEAMDSPKDGVAASACEVFAVHLCETVRLRLVQSLVLRSLNLLVPSHLHTTARDDEMTFLGSESCVDIFPDLLPPLVALLANRAATPKKPDLGLELTAISQVAHLIDQYKQVSVAWMTYVITQGKFCQLSQSVADRCGLKYIHTLRSSLGVLSNTNVTKVVSNLETAIRKPNFAHPHLGVRDISSIQSQLAHLLHSRTLSPVPRQDNDPMVLVRKEQA